MNKFTAHSSLVVVGILLLSLSSSGMNRELGEKAKEISFDSSVMFVVKNKIEVVGVLDQVDSIIQKLPVQPDYAVEGRRDAEKYVLQITWKDAPTLNQEFDLVVDQETGILISGELISAEQEIARKLELAIKQSTGLSCTTGELSAFFEMLSYLVTKINEINKQGFQFEVQRGLSTSNMLREIRIVQRKGTEIVKTVPFLREESSDDNAEGFTLWSCDKNSDCTALLAFQRRLVNKPTYVSVVDGTPDLSKPLDFVKFRRAFLVPHLKSVMRDHFGLEFGETPVVEKSPCAESTLKVPEQKIRSSRAKTEQNNSGGFLDTIASFFG